MKTRDRQAYETLAQRFAMVGKLTSVRMLLFWDAQTVMPKGASWGRGEQVAALQELSSDIISEHETQALLVEAENNSEVLDESERANLREMRRLWKRGQAVPATLLAQTARLSQKLQVNWQEAKKLSRFDLFAPGFQELLTLYKEAASAVGEALDLSPYEALMDEYDPGVTSEIVGPLFKELETYLPELRREVLEKQSHWPKPIDIEGDFSVSKQRQFSKQIAAMVGHTDEHNRIDEAPHPFMLPRCPGDARFTTRYDTNKFRAAIKFTLHEAGHAMYELNLPRTLAFQPAGYARGATMHESQSLILDMQAGRSVELLGCLAPRMCEAFTGSGNGWNLSNIFNIYRRINEGYLRSDADEISYLLHILLRYKIERALFADELSVQDIPDAWNQLSEELFGKTPPNDSLGCLQDIHWSAGWIGYFPSYALAAALAAQFFSSAVTDDLAILPALSEGDLHPLIAWGREHVHRKASLQSFNEIVVNATGHPLNAEALKRHLRRRYLEEPIPGEQ